METRIIKSKTIEKCLSVLKEMKYKADNGLKMDTASICKRYHTNQAVPYSAKLLGYFEIKSPGKWICKKDRFDPFDAKKILNNIYDTYSKQQEKPIPENRNVKGQFIRGGIPHNKPALKHTIKREVLETNNIDTDLWNEPVNKDKFIPPSLSDVEKYCNEKGFNIYPPDFITYYNNKGWTVGTSGGKRTPMKDWKKAIHNWMRNDNKYAVKKSSELSDQEIRDEWEKRGLSERKELSDFPFPEIFDYVKECGWTGKMTQEIQF